MPLVRINADGNRPVVMAGDDLGRAIARHPENAPVVVLIHGYKFLPGEANRCPHSHILSLSPRQAPRAVSWPRHLGFGRDTPSEGLCLAFGWNAGGSIWEAHRRAPDAAEALSALVRSVTAETGRPVHLVAHSLGGRVALLAVARLPEGSVGRAILIAGAATRAEAERALCSPAGRTLETVNVRSSENTVFDLLFRAAILPHRPFERTLGAGLGRGEPRWIDLSIDCPGTLSHLSGLGFRIPAPERRICHWSGYLRPGLFPLYRALLRTEGALSLSMLSPPGHRGGGARRFALRLGTPPAPVH